MSTIIPIFLKCWIKRFQLTWRFYFAHHPLCDRFENHIWRIGPFIVCQGCFLVFLGAVSSLIIFFIFQIKLYYYQWLLIASFLVILPILTEFFLIKKRKIKKFMRFSIGTAFGAFIWIFLTLNIFMKFFAFLFFIISYFTFFYIRKSKHTEETCKGCFELGNGIICSGLKHKTKAMQEYSEYATKLFEKRITERVEELYYKNKEKTVNL